MKKAGWILRFTGICIVAFAAGIITGFIKNGAEEVPRATEGEREEKVQHVSVEEETLLYMPKKLKSYKVVSRGDLISLCEVFEDESENVIERAEFNPSVLPVEDIELLKEGIVFADKDEALLMIENFVS